ncbi:hypothetical protein [Ruania zhangjianzhongii]|uniref:hypothetical protein n=1 Tax=Ruania zhangjianzhongii TaxID=2603206 RepID=UPI0011CC3557|nr:hypothetical protein [Ruania zhangjianzhongii]
MSTWQRTSGQVDAPASRVHRSTGFLDGAQVVARLEYDPQDPTTAWVTVAVDEEHRVAVLGEGGEQVVPGPPLAELVTALAQECQGVVTFAEESASAIPPGEGDEDGDDDPFDPQIGIAVVADRALVCTIADHAGLERLATGAETTLHAVPTDSGHTVVVEDGPAVGDLPLAELGAPALVLQQAADYPALGVAGDEEYQYVWGLQHAVVPLDAPVAEQFADRHLGTGALVDQVLAAVPGADAGRLRAAIDAGAGPADVLPVLGLGPEVTGQLSEFLNGQRGAADVVGVAAIHPVPLGEMMRRRAQEAADDARRAADDTRRRAQLAAEDARRMAEEARASAAAFADAAEEPVRTWAPWVAAGADVLVGALLWRRSGRAPRAGESMGAGAKVVRGVSVLLFAAAAANVTGAVLDGRRRADS